MVSGTGNEETTRQEAKEFDPLQKKEGEKEQNGSAEPKDGISSNSHI